MRGPGVRGRLRGMGRGPGKQEVASRGEVARARAGERRAHALVLLSEEGDDRRQRGGGLAASWRWAR